jgi:hypothetical protein
MRGYEEYVAHPLSEAVGVLEGTDKLLFFPQQQPLLLGPVSDEIALPP